MLPLTTILVQLVSVVFLGDSDIGNTSIMQPVAARFDTASFLLSSINTWAQKVSYVQTILLPVLLNTCNKRSLQSSSSAKIVIITQNVESGLKGQT